MPYTRSYPFIWANGVYWGSYEYYMRDEEQRAREDDAPQDAVYWTRDENDLEAPRIWTTMRDLKEAKERRGGEAYDKLMSIATARWWVAEA